MNLILRLVTTTHDFRIYRLTPFTSLQASKSLQPHTDLNLSKLFGIRTSFLWIFSPLVIHITHSNMSFSLRKWSTPRQVVPDPASMPADPQDQSPLFTTLPIEIRRNIYRQLWLDYGLTQHVLSISSNSYLQTFPCILSPEELNQEPVPPPPLHIADAPADAAGDGGAGADANGEPDQAQPHDDPGDINGALQDLTPGDATAPEPPPQSSTPWCGHYRCFRRWSRRWDHSFSRIYTACYRGGGGGRAPPDLAASPVLTAFLVCRRAYREAGESLFSSVRFSFASMTALDAFLGKVPRPLASRIQFADVCLRSAYVQFRFPWRWGLKCIQC